MTAFRVRASEIQESKLQEVRERRTQIGDNSGDNVCIRLNIKATGRCAATE